MTAHVPKLTPSGLINFLSFLLESVEARDWAGFEEAALPNPRTFRIASESISQCEEFGGATLLHACARYDPPVGLLGRMIELYPRALEMEDRVGRTPLHIAAGCGASPPVIELLAASFPRACDVQDEDGMTPLHFACDVGCVLYEGDEVRPRDPPHLETIKSLLEGSRDAVTLEDVDEINAVEYAIMSNASLEVVNLLQRTMQGLCKKQKNIIGPRSRAYQISAVASMKVQRTAPSA